jgi:very-short-patch-repair endonuclease
MWRLLRENFPVARFRRQVPIRSFVAALLQPQAELVLEVDRGQHSEEQDPSGRD